MSKVLVDRELLERIVNTNMADYAVIAYQRKEIRFILEAQPAETERVSTARLMNTLAELARRAPLRTLHTICETQRQVSTVKLERYLGPVGDTLAGYAFTLRIDFDKLSAALSAVTAERDRLESMLIRTTTRHFAQQWKDRADDKRLDECLSEGIAMLEAERDRLREDRDSQQRVCIAEMEKVSQLRVEVERLRPVVREFAGFFSSDNPRHWELHALADGAAMAAKEA